VSTYPFCPTGQNQTRTDTPPPGTARIYGTALSQLQASRHSRRPN